jgi:multidrug efflux pump subunit AcrA (membrane-fusion protein)
MIRVSDRSMQSGIFKTMRLQPGMVRAEVIAPARVVAGASAALAGEGRPIILFDSPDMASLYSTFTQSAASYDKARKELARTRDLFDHQAATGRDVAEAQAAVATAQASLGESEAKIRALGFNPEELGSTRSGVTWLISDVPESQLYEVQRGERTSIELPSFPGETFYGHVEAIGDVVDDATRTVKVRIAVPNPGGRIKPGMYAGVNFGQSQTSVMAVPQGAVVTVLGRHYAFVERAPGQFERRDVELGRQVGDSIIVSGGIRRGESVVVEGTILLKGLSFGY